MELENPNNGENQMIQNPNNGDPLFPHQIQRSSEEIDSTCSTPYVSAPSSPSRCPNGYFFSAPASPSASPMHLVLSSSSSSSEPLVYGSFEFEFSARFSNSSIPSVSMSSADELFLNGQIRPMKLSSHLQKPQFLAPLLVLDEEDEERKDSRDLEFVNRDDSMMRGRDLRVRNRSLHRRARSLSPLRNESIQWYEGFEERDINEHNQDLERKQTEATSIETVPSVSASSSRSSSSGRNSKRWVFLKDFLRSKSEGRGNGKEKFWNSISFSPGKEKKSPSKEKKPISSSSMAETPMPKRSQQVPAKSTDAVKPTNGVGKRRILQSPHELHYTVNRAQAEEMKKKTYLPYRQGLLGCLGFSSKSYGAMNGFSKALNPVSSR